jgi:hypothetical protein
MLISMSVNASSHFHLRNAGGERVAMQRDRQQKQSADQRARPRYHHGVDFGDGDANQEIGHAPKQAQREKQNPPVLRHRPIVENA